MLKKASMLSVAILLLALAIGSYGQAAKAAKPDDPMVAKWIALNQEFEKAQTDYFAPYEKARTEEEQAKIKLDPAKNPSKVFLPRFRALALEAGKSDTAAKAWLMAYSLATGATDVNVADEAMTHIISDHSNAPEITRFLAQVSYGYRDLKSDQRREKIFSVFDRVDKATTSNDTHAAVLYYRAKTIESTKGNPADVSSTYDKLIAQYPNTQFGKVAKGDKFEAENLVPGKPALDFEAEDQDGVKFKLSDYRGKVVVLDFWGWW